jgi:hypothetical protein
VALVVEGSSNAGIFFLKKKITIIIRRTMETEKKKNKISNRE